MRAAWAAHFASGLLLLAGLAIWGNGRDRCVETRLARPKRLGWNGTVAMFSDI
jgi:hypothetical protein